MISLCLFFLIIIAVCLIAVFSKRDARDDSRYYIGGLHIYYDRKIFRRIAEENNLNQPEL